ncbi:702_t:CDS:1, partial [Funneliformis geosporum]
DKIQPIYSPSKLYSLKSISLTDCCEDKREKSSSWFLDYALGHPRVVGYVILL